MRDIPPVGSTRFARLRRAVPTPTGRTGRRSAFQAVPAILRGWRYVVRWASPSGADRRSAFPEPSPRFCADRRYAVRSSEIGGAQRCWCGFRAPARCRSETGAPCARDSAWWRTAEREKNKWQRTPFAARDFGGKCERGDSSLSQDGNDQSELAAARRRRAREFRLPARSAGRTPDGAPTPSRTTTESYSRSRPRPGTARP